MPSVGCLRATATRISPIRRAALRCDASLPAVPVTASVRPASARTKDIASRIMLAPNLNPASRAIVIGSGGLAVVDVLKYLGLQDILVVDPSEETLAVVGTAYELAGSLGNEPGVRLWQGDFCELPAYLGSADMIVFTDEPFGTAQTPRDALIKACLSLRPGGSIVINSELDNRRWQPKFPPTRQALAALVAGLPVVIHSEQEAAAAYCGILQLPPHYRLRTPLRFEGEVVRGFGRGSRQMGTPTANIDTTHLKSMLGTVAPGVYFGWAKLDAPAGWPAVDREVHKVVLNVGVRPTVNTGKEAASVECHILHTFVGGEEFYGSRLKVLVLGFIRPEMKFSGLEALVGRIRADTAIARYQLDEPGMRADAALLDDGN